jgi:transcriptional regulator with XRE-family HTH domain
MALPQGPYYRALGEQVRARRKRQGLTQEQLAAAVGLTRTSITNIEMGRQPVYVHILEKIAQNLRTSVSDFLPDPDTLDTALKSRLAGLPKDRKDWIATVISQEKR